MCTCILDSKFIICTLLGTYISASKGTFEDDFPFPQVGYVIVPWRVQ